jgi:hypothetical protein
MEGRMAHWLLVGTLTVVFCASVVWLLTQA